RAPASGPLATPACRRAPDGATHCGPYPPPASASRAEYGTASPPSAECVVSETCTGTPDAVPVRRGRAGRTVSTVVAAGPEPPGADPWVPEPPGADPGVPSAPVPEGTGGPMAVLWPGEETPEGRGTRTRSPSVTGGELIGFSGTVITRVTVVTW